MKPRTTPALPPSPRKNQAVDEKRFKGFQDLQRGLDKAAGVKGKNSAAGDDAVDPTKECAVTGHLYARSYS